MSDLEKAVPLDLGVQWDVGAPMPHLLRNDYVALLTFIVQECVNSDEERVDAVQLSVEDAELLALVTFVHCQSAKLGSPNDEVLAGHRLFKKGLEFYGAHEVLNSSWLSELEQLNSVHDGYKPEYWRRQRHYIFCFHDTTFECIAESFKIELFRATMSDLLGVACQRLLA